MLIPGVIPLMIPVHYIWHACTYVYRHRDTIVYNRVPGINMICLRHVSCVNKSYFVLRWLVGGKAGVNHSFVLPRKTCTWYHGDQSANKIGTRIVL